MKTRTPTIGEFKAFAKDVEPAARAVLLALAHAQLERTRVDAYILPIFQSFGFKYAGRWDKAGPIEKPEHLYLCDDDEALADYYAECDQAHRAHGFTGPAGHCPALTAETLVTQTENALIDLARPLFGLEVSQLYGEKRAKYLELLIGASIKAGAEAGQAASRRTENRANP